MAAKDDKEKKTPPAPPEPTTTEETITETKKVVTGKSITFPLKDGGKLTVKIGPDERILGFTEYDDRVVYVAEGPKGHQKRIAKK